MRGESHRLYLITPLLLLLLLLTLSLSLSLSPLKNTKWNKLSQREATSKAHPRLSQLPRTVGGEARRGGGGGGGEGYRKEEMKKKKGE